MMANSAYLSPDTVIINKKNLYMEENTSIPGGAMILNPRSRFIMKKGSFSSYNLCVCPGNHAIVKGVWKHDVTDIMKDEKNHIDTHYAGGSCSYCICSGRD